MRDWIRTGRVLALLAMTALASFGAGQMAALAADKPVFTLEIKDHHFVPSSLDVPADTRFILLVKNSDATPEEFESFELNREVVIAAKSEARINIGPLRAGRYPYYGEFNKATAQGTLIAK